MHLRDTGRTVARLPSIDYGALAEIRQLLPGRLAIKCVQTVAYAGELADLGVDAIIPPDHGGRQDMDRAIAILASEVRYVMRLLQVASIEELEPRHVTK